MRKKSVLLMSMSLALLVGLIGTAVVLAQGGEEWRQPVESVEVRGQATEVPVTEEVYCTSELTGDNTTGTNPDVPAGMSTAFPFHVEVMSGSMRFSRDSGPVEMSGRIIFRPAPAVGSDKISTQPTPIAVEETEVVSAARPAGIAPNTTCYIHYAEYDIGSTRVRRETHYCVNDYGNEVVTKLVMKNIGSNVTPVLYDEKLFGNTCPAGSILHWSDGPLTYQLWPGASVEWQPWVEIPTGWGETFKVRDEWETGWYYNCIGQ